MGCVSLTNRFTKQPLTASTNTIGPSAMRWRGTDSVRSDSGSVKHNRAGSAISACDGYGPSGHCSHEGGDAAFDFGDTCEEGGRVCFEDTRCPPVGQEDSGALAWPVSAFPWSVAFCPRASVEERCGSTKGGTVSGAVGAVRCGGGAVGQSTATGAQTTSPMSDHRRTSVHSSVATDKKSARKLTSAASASIPPTA